MEKLFKIDHLLAVTENKLNKVRNTMENMPIDDIPKELFNTRAILLTRLEKLNTIRESVL